MKMLNKLISKSRISVRLGGAFGLLLVFIGILGGLTTYDMGNLSTLTEKLYNHPYTVKTTALGLAAHIDDIHQKIIYDLSTEKSQDEINQTAVQLNDLFKTSYAEIDVLLDRYLGDKKEIEMLRTGFHEWFDIANQEVMVLQNDSRQKAIDEQEQQAIKNYLWMREIIQYLVAFSGNKAEELFNKAQEISQQKPAEGVNKTQEIMKLFETLYSHPFVMRSTVWRVDNNLVLARLEMKKLAHAKTIEEVEASVKVIMEYRDKITEDFATITKIFLGSKEKLKEFEDAFQAWQSTVDKRLALHKDFSRNQNATNLDNKSKEKYAALKQLINQINTFASNKAVSFMENAEAVKHRTLIFSYWFIGLAIVVGAILAYVISHSVVAPLMKAVDLSGELANGKLSSRADITHNSKDEISQMLTAMNQMADKQQNIIKDIRTVMSELSTGNLKVRITSDFPNDFADIKHSTNDMAEKLQSIINTTSRAVGKFASGDMSARIEPDFPGEFIEIKRSAK